MANSLGNNVIGGIGPLVGSLGTPSFARLWTKRQPFTFACGQELFERLQADFADGDQVRSVGRGQFRMGDGQFARSLRFGDGAAATDAYTNSRTVVAQNVDKTTPWLAAWILEFLAETRLPVSQAKANVFYSPARSGLARHFDNHEVVIVGLSGEKCFRVAPSAAVRFPHMNDDQYDDLSGSLAAERLSANLPGEREVVIGPGDAIHIPRGWWHATQTEAPTASITFGFWSSSLGDLMDTMPEGDLRRTPITVDDNNEGQARDVIGFLASTGIDTSQVAIELTKLSLASQSKYMAAALK